MRVLVVEDEPRMARLIRQGLEEDAYAVDVIGNGADALDWVQSADYDMVLLDILLPGMDGLAVCRQLRDHGYIMPILMLTALGTLPDKVSGLDSGADDYLVKPFAIKELLARMRALTRRASDAPKSTHLHIADLTLDTATHIVQRGGEAIDLTAKEFAILECLLHERGRVLSRTVIAEHVWNYDNFNQSNVVDVYIRNLRRKIDDGFEQKLIHTIRGVGYRIALTEGGVA